MPSFMPNGLWTVDALGYAASALVLVTFCMSTMTPLRLMAIPPRDSGQPLARRLIY